MSYLDIPFISRYNIKSRKWIELAPMSVARIDHASAVISNRILVMGGSGFRSVECYNPAANTWSQRAPMLRNRSNFEAGAANGFVYVIGGLGAIETVTSIERYSMESNTWTLVCEWSIECNLY